MIRRIMYYGMIASQVVIVIILAWQLNTAISVGTEIMITTKLDDLDDEYTYDLTDDYYAEFDINYIKAEKIEGSLKPNDTVYVLLTKRDHSYEVKSVSTEKKQVTENELVLQGTYMYEDNQTKEHFIEYGFERIKNIESYGQFTNQDRLKVTLIYAKGWNQYRVNEVKKMN